MSEGAEGRTGSTFSRLSRAHDAGAARPPAARDWLNKKDQWRVRVPYDVLTFRGPFGKDNVSAVRTVLSSALLVTITVPVHASTRTSILDIKSTNS